MKKIITAGLCNNRHDIPVDDYVFGDNIKDPTNVSLLEKQAKSWLKSKFQNQDKQKKVLRLYVTGLTPALIATINAAHKQGIKVILFHYNRVTNDYFPQKVY